MSDPVRHAIPRYETVSDARLRGPDPKDWLMYRRTYDGWGFSPLSEIDARNARELELAWAARTDADDGEPQAPGNLATTIRARLAPLGGVELELLPRPPIRPPPRFD